VSGRPYLIEFLGGDLDGKRFWFGCLPDEWRELLPPHVALPSLTTTAASLRRVAVSLHDATPVTSGNSYTTPVDATDEAVATTAYSGMPSPGPGEGVLVHAPPRVESHPTG
jgi:hypothetical protein